MNIYIEYMNRKMYNLEYKTKITIMKYKETYNYILNGVESRINMRINNCQNCTCANCKEVQKPTNSSESSAFAFFYTSESFAQHCLLSIITLLC